MKKVIAGCIEKIIEFDTQKEAAEYVDFVRESGKEFQVIERTQAYGKWRVQIREQYNKNPLLVAQKVMKG